MHGSHSDAPSNGHRTDLNSDSTFLGSDGRAQHELGQEISVLGGKLWQAAPYQHQPFSHPPLRLSGLPSH
jgi:hypothetical protein